MFDVDLAKNPMVDAQLLKQFEKLVKAVPPPAPVGFSIAHPFWVPVPAPRRVENHLTASTSDFSGREP